MVPTTPFQSVWIIVKLLNLGRMYIPTLLHKEKVKVEHPLALGEEREGQVAERLDSLSAGGADEWQAGRRADLTPLFVKEPSLAAEVSRNPMGSTWRTQS